MHGKGGDVSRAWMNGWVGSAYLSLLVNSFKCPAEMVGLCSKIMDGGSGVWSDQWLKTKPNQSYFRSWGEDNTEGFASATGEAMCHFPPWTGHHFSGCGIPREWKMNRTVIPMGLSCLILHAIWNSSPTGKYLHFKEKLQSYIKMASYTRGCGELVN